MSDAVHELAHDHADLNRRVLEVGAQIRAMLASATPAALVGPLGELREQLFMHFAREEEGLFPFVVEVVPALADHVRAMEIAHDTICGALARAFAMASANATVAAIAPVFDRFESAYAAHARAEAGLLSTVDSLDAAQRARLAALVEGL